MSQAVDHFAASHALRAHIQEVVPLTDAAFARVLSLFHTKRLRKHQFLIQQAEPVSHEYFVVSGCLKAYLINSEGKEHILQFASENWWISDFPAYFNQGKASLFVDCLEDSELLGISLEDKEQLCAELHEVEHFFRIKLTRSFAAMQNRILSYLNDSVQTRYEKFLRMYPDLSQRIVKQYIASYLGVSRETLSRLQGR